MCRKRQAGCQAVCRQESGVSQAAVVCVDSWQAVCWCGLDKDRAGTGQDLVWLVRLELCG